jgi:hypothetical protein
MALYLITSLFDEGIYPSSFRVVEAPSELAIAAHMLANPHQWEFFLSRSKPKDRQNPRLRFENLWECIQEPGMNPELFLQLIEMTQVDGDSYAQLAINEIIVESLDEINTQPQLLR